MEATVERERQTWSEARTDLQERTEGAERRSESLQSLTKELAQNNGDAEQRFQKVSRGYIYTPVRGRIRKQLRTKDKGSGFAEVVSTRICTPGRESAWDSRDT